VPDMSNMCMTPDRTIREAMKHIDRNRKGIVLVCEQERLVGTVTDGDIRRAILQGSDLEAPVSTIVACKRQADTRSPVTAPVGSDRAVVLKLMYENSVRQIPLLDAEGRVRDLLTLDELVPDQVLPMEAVIMAGGFGTRLRPLTEHVPKPMLPVGDRPLLQRTIERLRDVGISRVHLTTHYKAEVIQQHFGDGSEYGMDIQYVDEAQPMGTAGALCRINGTDRPLLIINGDILTNVDFRAMFEFHREHDAYMTIAVKQIELAVPYGVIELGADGVTGITEKPVMRHFINAGIFLLNSEACDFVPRDRPYDMPDLINALVEAEKRVVAFPIREYWLDIGQLEHYRRAVDDFRDPESEEGMQPT
jgi:dTDP-glucose pyrophosphorylase